MPQYSFRKEERLKSRKIINRLFQEGRSINNPPFRLLFLSKTEGTFPASIAIVVPKKSFKKAVERNIIKRRIRESYRLYKPEFYSQLVSKSRRYDFIVIYQGKDIADFKTIDFSLKKLLNILASK